MAHRLIVTRRAERETGELLTHFPYGIFFASKGEITSILAVIHTSRNPRRWPRRKPARPAE